MSKLPAVISYRDRAYVFVFKFEGGWWCGKQTVCPLMHPPPAGRCSHITCSYLQTE